MPQAADLGPADSRLFCYSKRRSPERGGHLASSRTSGAGRQALSRSAVCAAIMRGYIKTPLSSHISAKQIESRDLRCTQGFDTLLLSARRKCGADLAAKVSPFPAGAHARLHRGPASLSFIYRGVSHDCVVQDFAVKGLDSF